MKRRKSRGNVFADIGFDKFEAQELAVKSDLISLVALAIKNRKLTQVQAAKICGTHQTTLSKILSGKLDSITIDQLTKWIVALGGSVSIQVSQPSRPSAKKGSLSLDLSER